MGLKIIDISRDLITTPVYPGDPVPATSVFSAIENGDECNMCSLTTTLHCGTHADAPLHFIENGTPISAVPLEPFVGECAVIEVPPGRITGKFVEDNFPYLQKRLLIKSGGKAWFDKSGAQAAAYKGYTLIGTDSNSVGCAGEQTAPHKAFLLKNIAILENLDLTEVKPGKYFLVAQPIKIDGADAAPVRALLLDGYIFWSN